MRKAMVVRLAAHVVALVLFLGLMSCGSSTMDGPSLVIDNGSLIPDYTFVWRNTADSTNTYVFVPDNSGVHSGNITDSSTEVRNNVTSKVTGTFSEKKMNITVARPGGSVTASGGFTDNDTIKLIFSNSSSTIVTLIRIKQ
ncbi:MAG TPA: hypothetical protein VJN96_17770 [Vicinamibacterales bacterium]|nr:hypothetical protein [Vicinamibacterales bacterium]